MNPNLVSLANVFYVVAAVLGTPSLAATVLYGVFRLRLWLAPVPTGSSFDSVKNPDAILLMLGGMTRVFGAVGSVVGGLSQVVFGVVAAIASGVLLFSLALFLAGRGLHAHQEWARLLGGVLMGGVLLLSLAATFALRGPLALPAVALLAASGYAVLGLWRGFAV